VDSRPSPRGSQTTRLRRFRPFARQSECLSARIRTDGAMERLGDEEAALRLGHGGRKVTVTHAMGVLCFRPGWIEGKNLVISPPTQLPSLQVGVSRLVRARQRIMRRLMSGPPWPSVSGRV